MKSLALGITALAVLLSPVALVAVPGHASAAPRAITVSAPQSALTGSRVSFTGLVRKVPRGTKVRIQRRAGRAWHTQRTVATRSGGRYNTSLVVTGSGNEVFRAYATPRHGKPRSAATHVMVLRRVSVQLRSTRTNVQQGAPFTLNVTTSAPQVGGTVQLQSMTGTGTWQAAGTATLTRTGTGTFRPVPATRGTVAYRVVKPRHGYDAAAVSSAISVTAQPKGATFGQLMTPESTEVVDPASATWAFLPQAPAWTHNAEIRWDTPGAFTPSLTPEPTDALYGLPSPTQGAEFNNGNSSLQTVDVSFTATGTEFAIRYMTYDASTAMVWIDGHPISATPISGAAAVNSAQANWIRITLPQRRTVHVRFAGPDHFVGVDHDANVPLTVSAAPAPFTLGVISDSYYDSSVPTRTYEGSGAAVLHTRTGFRIWNLAQGGTGYLSDATPGHTGNGGLPGHYASPFGSDARIARIKDAPIDALLVNGSINDAGFSNEAYSASVNRFLDRVAQVRPGLPVVVLGLEPVTVTADDATWRADVSAKNAILKDIAAQHSNVVGFINPYDEHWLTGTGSIAAPQGDGNQDQYTAIDHIHLSAAGQAYYQDLVAQRMATMPATLSAP